ncbi:hypothetical protein VPNG_10182 [Cytospora leucostoma]|uniref:Uncharacterized protein n=1 Tax=Cytospora leucostoma TaxID=1230097 RepID=A0A423VFQ5_9PEZI|nr:hypothetical protein VPNG_10182 [Cytospora leucostoma]
MDELLVQAVERINAIGSDTGVGLAIMQQIDDLRTRFNSTQSTPFQGQVHLAHEEVRSLRAAQTEELQGRWAQLQEQVSGLSNISAPDASGQLLESTRRLLADVETYDKNKAESARRMDKAEGRLRQLRGVVARVEELAEEAVGIRAQLARLDAL